MASIVIKSEEFQRTGLVIQSQSVSEESNGLVRVQITYITTTDKRDAISRLFYTDSQPPIFPDCYNKNELQGRNLFLIDRTIMQENGFVTIDAKYAGALNRALTKPSILLGRESKSIQFKIRYAVVGDPPVEVFDQYEATLTTGVKSYSLAVVGDAEFVVGAPSFNDLFLGCIFTNKTLVYEGGVRFPQYDRNAPASELVFNNTTSSVGTDLLYNFLTPMVKIQTRRFFLNIEANQ